LIGKLIDAGANPAARYGAVQLLARVIAYASGCAIRIVDAGIGCFATIGGSFAKKKKDSDGSKPSHQASVCALDITKEAGNGLA
jgi:hypothetical protein